MIESLALAVLVIAPVVSQAERSPNAVHRVWSLGTSATLTEAPRQREADFPFATAELVVRNETHSVVRAAVVRPAGGGPAVMVRLPVAPNATARVTLALPAISQQEAYTVCLLAGEQPDAETLARLHVRVNWSEEVIERTGRALIDGEAYTRWESESPEGSRAVAVWSNDLRANVLIAAVLSSLALAGTLFVRSPATRAVTVPVVVLCASAALWIVATRESLTVQREAPAAGLTWAASRRTVTWRPTSTDLAPVYVDMGQYEADDLLVGPDGRLSVMLRPGQPRLFRRRSVASPQPAPAKGQ